MVYLVQMSERNERTDSAKYSRHVVLVVLSLAELGLPDQVSNERQPRHMSGGASLRARRLCDIYASATTPIHAIKTRTLDAIMRDEEAERRADSITVARGNISSVGRVRKSNGRIGCHLDTIMTCLHTP